MIHDAPRFLMSLSRFKLRLVATLLTVLVVFSAFRFAVGQGIVDDVPPAAAGAGAGATEVSAGGAALEALTADPAAEGGKPDLGAPPGGEATPPAPEAAKVPPAMGIVEKLKGFAGSCGLELKLSKGLSKSKRTSLPYEFSPGDNFIESFAAANGLVWFANGRALYVSEREDHRAALVPVDREFGERVIVRLVEQRQLQDLGAGKYGLGCNQIQFMETPHAFVTGHIEFLRFIKEKFGIQTGAIAKTESGGVDLQAPDSQPAPAAGDAGSGGDGAGVVGESGSLSVLGTDRLPTQGIDAFTGEGASYAESAVVGDAGQIDDHQQGGDGESGRSASNTLGWRR